MLDNLDVGLPLLVPAPVLDKLGSLAALRSLFFNLIESDEPDFIAEDLDRAVALQRRFPRSNISFRPFRHHLELDLNIVPSPSQLDSLDIYNL